MLASCLWCHDLGFYTFICIWFTVYVQSMRDMDHESLIKLTKIGWKGGGGVSTTSMNSAIHYKLSFEEHLWR